MMYNYPFFGFPSFRRNYYKMPNYYNSNYYKTNQASKSFNNKTSINSNSNNNSQSSANTKKEPNFSSSIQTESKKLDFSCDNNFYNDADFFNIFGFSLHIDDLLILALLFFLYQEGIEDMYLYIALILLLFS